jgi:hypothetical protein
MLFPSKRIADAFVAALFSSNLAIASAVVDFPDPLSPTIARHDAGWISKLIPFTALVGLEK